MTSLHAISDGILKHAGVRLVASAASGVLLVLAFPLPHLRGVVWVACLPLFLALVSERKLGRGFLLGLATGVVFLAGSLYWFV
ncbi:MAG: apolipoprotein N-acyltransferase, partial [Terriglobia bacterium]